MENLPPLAKSLGQMRRWLDIAAGAAGRRAAGRREAGLPADGFVFVNFNKNDKLEPRVFTEWMNVLRRVAGSVLWLLSSQASAAFDTLKATLRAEAALRGVHPGRLVFAPRAPKPAHLARHKLADLFIDTHVYGAHSTATDALRGGCPFLTSTQLNFAGRVGTGLLQTSDMDAELVVHGAHAFEDAAVELAQRPRALRALRYKLHATADKLHLFNTEQYTQDFEAAGELMWEVRRATGGRGAAGGARHIVQTGRPHKHGFSWSDERQRGHV